MAGEDWLYQVRPSVLVASTKAVRFRDINCDYTIDQNDITVDDHAAIQHRIRHLLSTPLGSEIFEPNFGSNLPYRIMDPITPTTGFILETDTIVAIAKWMSSEITIGANVRIEPLEVDDGYLITIPYYTNDNGTGAVYSFEALR